MRAISYHRAKTPAEAVGLAEELGPDAEFLAGGQSLVNMMKQRLVPAGSEVIDIGGIEELAYVRRDGDRLCIGALTTHAALLESPDLVNAVPAFGDMLAQLAGPQVRNLGTIGGDLAQADPRADYPVLLTALGAELTATGPDGDRVIPVEDFHEGYFETALEPAELLAEVAFDVPGPDTAVGFAKFAETMGAYPQANAGAHLTVTDGACSDARIRVGCLSGTPMTPDGAEAELVDTPLRELDAEDAGTLARRELEPDPDEQRSETFQADLIDAMVTRAVRDAVDRLREA